MAEKIKWVTCGATLGIVAICVLIIVFEPAILPMLSRSTPTATQSSAILSRRYQPEVIPPQTDTPNPVLTATNMPTDTPIPTITSTFTLTPTPIDKPLPDLIVAGISDPVCAKGYFGDTLRNYVKLKMIIRNIGHASTHYFGSFDVGVYVLVGQSSFGLDEWADKFNGVIASPNLKISNLDPNRDVTFTLAIDIKGMKEFGIKVIANSGANPIPEMDTVNNALIKHFSQCIVISFVPW